MTDVSRIMREAGEVFSAPRFQALEDFTRAVLFGVVLKYETSGRALMPLPFSKRALRRAPADTTEYALNALIKAGLLIVTKPRHWGDLSTMRPWYAVERADA